MAKLGMVCGQGDCQFSTEDEMEMTRHATAHTRHPNSKRFHDLLQEIGDLHDRKQHDYGTKDDPFANLNASSELGIDPVVGIFLRMNDKWTRIKSFIQKGVLRNESVEDSLMDIAVYALIAVVKIRQRAESKQEYLERVIAEGDMDGPGN